MPNRNCFSVFVATIKPSRARKDDKRQRDCRLSFGQNIVQIRTSGERVWFFFVVKTMLEIINGL